MKATAYPIKIQVEKIGFGGRPMIVHEVVCNTHRQLTNKFLNLKTLYNLESNYKIYFVLNSKVNARR